MVAPPGVFIWTILAENTDAKIFWKRMKNSGGKTENLETIAPPTFPSHK